MKQNYYVAMRVEARYYVDVEAASVEEVKKLAGIRFTNTYASGISQMDFLDREVISVEDEEGNYVYEK